MNNRHVPLIIGLLSVSGGVAMVMWSVWLSIPAAVMAWFGWASIKTGLFASSDEIDELTGKASMSEATRQRFEDRL